MITLRCADALTLATMRQDGERVSGTAARALEAHLRSCAGCRRDALALRRTSVLYRACLPAVHAPLWVKAATRARVTERQCPG